jgi:hypothetical protein
VPDKSSTFPTDSLRAKRSVVFDDDTDIYSSPLLPSRNGDGSKASDNKNFTVCLRYSAVLFQDFVAENEMVIVEEPWMSVLGELPDALARRVYGT